MLIHQFPLRLSADESSHVIVVVLKQFSMRRLPRASTDDGTMNDPNDVQEVKAISAI
jgi:hypothetical protein